MRPRCYKHRNANFLTKDHAVFVSYEDQCTGTASNDRFNGGHKDLWSQSIRKPPVLPIRSSKGKSALLVSAHPKKLMALIINGPLYISWGCSLNLGGKSLKSNFV